jgi:hypothetical protein
MKRNEPDLEKLIHEAEEARLREAILEATGEDLLDRAREVAQTVKERVRRVTTPTLRRPEGDA